jgi:Xaa-Pro aminopeptidase
MCHNSPTRVEGIDMPRAAAVLDPPLINLGGLRRLFESLDVAALVCRGGVNVAYLSGVSTPGTLGRHLDLADTERETFIVWPRDGEPAIVVSEIAGDIARASSWIGEIRTYRDYADAPESVLARLIADRGFETGRVAFDFGWFGARRWSELRRLLPGVEAVDCTHDLDAVRAAKTPAEVVRLRHAAHVLDRAIADVFPTVREGQTERQVHAAIVGRALELGAGSCHGILQSSSNRVLYGGESDVRLAAGDLVRTDYVAYVDGYAANVSRLLHVGRPDAAVLDRYAKYLEIYRECVALLVPGATGGAVHDAIRAVMVAHGWPPGPPISGHGVGVWFHQQRPLLVEGSEDRLEPGMVVAIEPISGHWHLQDEYLIAGRSPERVSDSFPLEELAWAG